MTVRPAQRYGGVLLAVVVAGARIVGIARAEQPGEVWREERPAGAGKGHVKARVAIYRRVARHDPLFDVGGAMLAVIRDDGRAFCVSTNIGS